MDAFIPSTSMKNYTPISECVELFSNLYSDLFMWFLTLYESELLSINMVVLLSAFIGDLGVS